MTVFYDNIRVKLSTGCSVDPKLWLEKKQRVKVTIENQDANIINDKLDQYEAVMDSLMKKYRDEDFYPSPEVIKADLMKLNKVPTKSKKAKTFWDHFEDFIADKRKINPDVRIQPHDFMREELHIIPKKTKKLGVKKVIIPLSERLKRILNKYDGVLPNLDKNHITNFNKMIREICESLNMRDEIKFYREIAGQTIKVTKYKFEEVSSHTCRRTFCTLKFLKGMPAQAIMKFTGHTSERNFLKYLKLDAELTAQKYKGYF